MLVATELVSQFAVLDDLGSDVILWVAVHEASDVSGSPRVIIGVYTLLLVVMLRRGLR